MQGSAVLAWLLQGSVIFTYFFCFYSRPCSVLARMMSGSMSESVNRLLLFESSIAAQVFPMFGSMPQYMDHLLISLLSSCRYFPYTPMHELCWNLVFRVVHFQIEWHLCKYLSNGNSPMLWLDAYHAPLIPVAPGFSWQCDLGRWRSLEPCFALCVKITYHLQYATMWLPLH